MEIIMNHLSHPLALWSRPSGSWGFAASSIRSWGTVDILRFRHERICHADHAKCHANSCILLHERIILAIFSFSETLYSACALPIVIGGQQAGTKDSHRQRLEPPSLRLILRKFTLTYPLPSISGINVAS